MLRTPGEVFKTDDSDRGARNCPGSYAGPARRGRKSSAFPHIDAGGRRDQQKKRQDGGPPARPRSSRQDPRNEGGRRVVLKGTQIPEQLRGALIAAFAVFLQGLGDD